MDYGCSNYPDGIINFTQIKLSSKNELQFIIGTLNQDKLFFLQCGPPLRQLKSRDTSKSSVMLMYKQDNSTYSNKEKNGKKSLQKDRRKRGQLAQQISREKLIRGVKPQESHLKRYWPVQSSVNLQKSVQGRICRLQWQLVTWNFMVSVQGYEATQAQNGEGCFCIFFSVFKVMEKNQCLCISFEKRNAGGKRKHTAPQK